MSVKGTPAFMAPEVIRVLHMQLSSKEDIGGTEPTFYDFKCDVWSVGVIVYTLLVGDRPFSLEEVSEYVAEGTPLPDLAQIQDVKAAEAIAPAMLESECPLLWEFVSKCLVPEFDKRPSSAELLECELFQQPQAPPSEEAASQLKGRLRSYAALTKFKRAALLAASRHLGAYEHEEHRALFQQIDLDNSGSVSAEELRAAFKCAPVETPGAAGIDELLVALDSDKTGDISYTEFIAAVMDTHLEEHRDLAQAAFDTFDIDGDGLITKAELDLVLKCGGANEILLLGDKDLDGAINFEEFIDLIKRG